jgi:hypothetical protein
MIPRKLYTLKNRIIELENVDRAIELATNAHSFTMAPMSMTNSLIVIQITKEEYLATLQRKRMDIVDAIHRLSNDPSLCFDEPLDRHPSNG